jgi:hypothetical protein
MDNYISLSNPDMCSYFSEEIFYYLASKFTGNFFIEPVVASDGFTYEKTEILDFVNQSHISPETLEPMEPVFYDNICLKKIIQSLVNPTLEKRNLLSFLVSETTGKIFLEPIVMIDGSTCEKEDVLSKEILPAFYENLSLKNIISIFLQENPSLVEKQYKN